MKEKIKTLAGLFLTFFKIGAFTFGGGYAMIPLIQKETVEKKQWIRDEDIIEIVAIAESTPGPVAVNAATFVGYRTAGFWGAFSATLGLVLPSFAVILAVSFLLREFYEIRAVRYAFMGIRAAVLALILRALVTMYRQSPKKIVSYVIMAASLILVAFFKVPVIFVIIGCGACGLVCSLIERRRQAK